VETGRGGGGVKREGEIEEGNERVGVRGGARLDHAWTVQIHRWQNGRTKEAAYPLAFFIVVEIINTP
jgi:hypothetical protein